MIYLLRASPYNEDLEIAAGYATNEEEIGVVARKCVMDSTFLPETTELRVKLINDAARTVTAEWVDEDGYTEDRVYYLTTVHRVGSTG